MNKRLREKLLQNIELLEWLTLLAIFLVVGAVGHDPWWKRGEAYSFGIVYHFYTTHTWLIPVNSGMPFMEKPPLYYWTAELFCNALDKLLTLPDAARLASALYTIVATFFTWKAGKVLFAQEQSHKSTPVIAALLLLGTYGLIRLSHALTTDIALFAGTTIAIYGMALICMQSTHWIRAGFWLGLGMGVTFMSKGLVMPVALGISGFILWAILPQLHGRVAVKAVALAVVMATPFFILWPAMVHQFSPTLFMEWFWDNNIGRFMGFSVAKLGAENNRTHLLLTLLTFAFPTLYLAIAQTIYARKHWREPAYLVPLVITIITMAILFSSASGRSPYFLPLLPGFALLGAPLLTRLHPLALKIWNILARIGFSGFTLGVWIVWWNLLQPPTEHPLPWLAKYFDFILPADFIPQGHQITACVVALIVAVFWLLSFRLKTDTALGTARIWFMGAALAWCTTYTLLLPWINETRSFRSIVAQMQEFVDHSPYKGQCINHYQVGENMAPMLEYFTGKVRPTTFFDFNTSTCPLFLSFTPATAPADIDPHWHMIWSGSKFLDLKDNELRLYARVTPHS